MKYYVIAGERSGDLHASNLIKSLKKEDPDFHFRGIGGDYMKDQGVELIIHYKDLAVMGFLEVLKNIFTIRKYLNLCLHDIKVYQPDAIIFIDFGGFNLRIASKVHALNIRKFYYIPPKIWAWNQKRAYKIKKVIDKAFVILPFEEAFYNKFEVNTKYVGNPVLDAINTFQPDTKFVSKHLIIKTKGIIALLPGSRKQELHYALPKYIELARAFPEKTFGLSTINSLPFELYEKALEEPNIIPVIEDNYNLLLNAEAAIVTSGTATLEAAIFEVPQIVTYEGSKLSYEIARRLVKVKYISLVNLIADEAVVREFIQKDFTPENLIEELKNILENDGYRAKILRGYKKIRLLLGEQNASANTAAEIYELLSAKRSEFN
jgi:lipid-A-disaccharide synthase